MKQLLMTIALVLAVALKSGNAAEPDDYVIDAWQVQDGLPHNEILGIAQSAEGFLWLATPQGLARFDGTRFRQFTKEHIPELARGRIGSMKVDHEGGMWVGLEDGSLLFGYRGQLRAVTPEQGWPTAGVHGIYADGQNRILVSDREGRVFRAAQAGLTPWLDARHAAPGEFVGINVDFAGVVCVRHGNTLSWWANDHWERLKAPAGQADFFALKTGAARLGGLWIGGRDGVQRFHDGQWREGKRLFPQPLRSIQLIMEDSRNQVWVTTGDGHVLRFDPSGAVPQFDFIQRVSQAPVRHLFEDDEGNLWAGTQGAGLVRFHPMRSHASAETNSNIEVSRPSHRTAPRIVLDEVWADSRLVARTSWPRAEPGQTGNGEARRPAMKIPVGAEVVTIRYEVVNLSPSQNLRRQYRLDEVDRDWIEAGTAGVASYTNLPSRRYVFHVRAARDAAEWSEGKEALAFVVAARFWQTWPFRLVATVALLGGLIWGYHIRVSALERSQALQQSFSRRLIESQEAERQRIAADLHDSLGQKLLVIKNDAQFGLLTRNTPEVLTDQLRRVSDTASECLEEVRHIALNLRPYQLDQLGLTKAIRSIVSQVERAGLKWERVDMDDVDGLFAPALEINLYRIVQEACSNILRHSAASCATLRMERRGRELHLSIADNGCGFDLRTAGAAGLKPCGFGLTGIRERVQILGGQLEIQSAPGQGTTLFIKLPIQPEHDESDHSDRR